MEPSREAEDGGGCLPSSPLKLYETQFFGFTPKTCMLRVYSAFQDCLCDILLVVEKVCVRQLSRGGSAADEERLRARARECSRQLQQFLEGRFKQLSERMEALLLSRCFSVPPNVLLPEDKSHHKYPQDVKVTERKPSEMCLLWYLFMNVGKTQLTQLLFCKAPHGFRTVKCVLLSLLCL